MQTRNWFLLALLAFFWATSFPFVEISLTEISPYSIVFWRLVPVGFVFMAAALLAGHRFPFSPMFWFPFVVLAVFFNIIPYLLISSGQKYIESGIASILNASTPIFTVVLAHFIFADEKLNGIKIFGIMIGTIGVAILFGLDALTDFSLYNLGQVYVLIAGACYAFCGVYARKYTTSYPVFKATAALLFCSALLSFPMVLFFEGAPQMPERIDIRGALLFTSFCGTGFAYLIYYYLLRNMGAGGTSLVTFLIAPIALLLSWLLLDESLGWNAYLGLLLILTALICMDKRVQNYLLKKTGSTPL